MKERFERALHITLLIFVLAAAGFLSAVTTVRIAIRGRVVTMPNLVGQSAAAAQKAVSGRGLRLRIEDRVYSTQAVNTVVRQSPPPGEDVKVSQDAHVVLSLGAQAIAIPPLEGNSLRAARIALLQAGLQLGEVSEIFVDSSEPDTVLRQNPPAGTMALSPRVDVLVSAGDRPEGYVMPAIVGMQQADAERTLTGDGLRVTKVTNILDANAPKGAVVGQKPPRGQRISRDTTVELGVSD